MRSLTYDELLTVTETDQNLLKRRRRHDHVALAFGRRFIFKSLRYLAIDAVAMLIAETIAKNFGHTTAARLVRCDGDIWATAIAMSEEHPDRPANYAIVEFDRNGKREFLTAATNSIDTGEIARKLSMSKVALGATAQRITLCNVTPLIAVIRRTGAAYDIDLSAPFLPAPNSDDFKALFNPYAETVKTIRDTVEAKRVAGEKARKLADASVRAAA